MLSVRPGVEADVPQIWQMLHAAAVDQGFEDELVVTEEDLLRDGFTGAPLFRALLAEEDGDPAGLALWFLKYSTWGSRQVLYLEDLYVKPAYRGRRVGRLLMEHLARIAVEEGCARFQWVVHEANHPAIRLYASVSAEHLHEWRLMSLDKEGIRRLAGD